MNRDHFLLLLLLIQPVKYSPKKSARLSLGQKGML